MCFLRFFVVVRSACEILTANGFRELTENEPWKLAANDCVFVTKNRTSLFAIAVGGAYKPGEGFGIIGAHTDSPCLRLKPLSERVKEGFVELAVQTYGGGLWYTWFDRDLTLAGRCIVRNSTTGALEERLVHIDRPLACVPSLAIHLNRNVNKSFAPDPEVHLAPILCTTLTEQVDCLHSTLLTGQFVVDSFLFMHVILVECFHGCDSTFWTSSGLAASSSCGASMHTIGFGRTRALLSGHPTSKNRRSP